VTPPSPTQPSGDGGEVFGPIGDYAAFLFRCVGRHKVLAVAAFLAVAAAGVLAAKVVPLKYEVRATLLAQRTVGRDGGLPAREIIVRRENLIALCEQTDFVRRYRQTRSPAARARDWLLQKLVGSERSDAQLLDDLVNTLEQRLSVSFGADGTVSISFVWSNPDLAFDLVEAAVQGFLEARNASEIGALGESIAMMEARDLRLHREILAAIEQLQQKERALRIESSPKRAPVAKVRPARDEELVRLQATLEARRRALAEIEASRQRRINELQLQLQDLLTTYAPEHPIIDGARQTLERLSKPSAQVTELRSEVGRLERDVVARGGDLRQGPALGAGILDVEMESARQRILETVDPRVEIERGQLETLLRQRAALLDRLDEARTALETTQAAFQQRNSVITPPRRPRGPLKPLGLMLVLAGLAGGVGAAFVAAAVADLSRGRVLERWQVEHSLGLPVLGELRPRR